MVNGYYIQKLKIQPNAVTLYRKWEGERTQRMKDFDLMANFNAKETSTIKERRRTYCGQMTKGSRKRMVDAINLFSQCCRTRWVESYSHRQKKMKRFRHKFAFVTLTIPINSYRVRGKDGYRYMLAPFIDWLTKTMGVNTYIWKAELQSPLYFQSKLKKLSKGQLHYHMVIPNFIRHDLIRNKWNSLLRKKNYTDIPNPPSTSIEKPYKGKNTCDYIVKEITKNCVSTKEIDILKSKIRKATENDEMVLVSELEAELDELQYLWESSNSDLQGKVWGCSNNLKPKMILPENLNIERDGLREKIDEYLSKIKNNPLNEYYRAGEYNPINKTTSNYTNYVNKFNIEKIKKIVHGFNVINKNFSGYLAFVSDKSQLAWLRKKLMKLYKRQERCFEIEYSREIHDMLIKTVAGYRYPIDGGQDWVINYYKNDYVEKWTFPNDYHLQLLECKRIVHSGIDGILRKPLIYDYEEFLIDRVGEVNTKDYVKNK